MRDDFDLKDFMGLEPLPRIDPTTFDQTVLQSATPAGHTYAVSVSS